MKKILILLFFFGSFGLAMAQVAEVTPPTFQAPVQWSRAMYNTNRGATKTLCPSKRELIACPNDRSKGYLYLPSDTFHCDSDGMLSTYSASRKCYKGQPWQKGENLTDENFIGSFKTEDACINKACPAKPFKVKVVVGDAPECPEEVMPPPAGMQYLREAPEVAVTFLMSGGTPPYRVSIEYGRTYTTESMVTVFMNAYSARKVSGTVSDSGSPRNKLPFKVSVPACKRTCCVPIGTLPAWCEQNHCRCLSSASVIATPIGAVPVTDLRVGDIVWTQDTEGNRIVRPVVRASHVPATNHRVVHLVLRDGRTLDVSALHPTADGRVVGDLRVGEVYDGSAVKSATIKPYEGDATHDILPAGDTGFYWANGILMGSTLR